MTNTMTSPLTLAESNLVADVVEAVYAAMLRNRTPEAATSGLTGDPLPADQPCFCGCDCVTAAADEYVQDSEPESLGDALTDELESDTAPAENGAQWSAFFDKSTLAMSFRAEYDTDDGKTGVLKVEYDYELDGWYFHNTLYDDLADVTFYTSNFLHNTPGPALVAAVDWALINL